jgi:hypothetical protein
MYRTGEDALFQKWEFETWLGVGQSLNSIQPADFHHLRYSEILA